MYEIQVYIENARTPWIASGNLPRKENNFATREEAAKMLTKIRSSGMDYRVMRIGDAETDELDLIKLKAQIKAITGRAKQTTTHRKATGGEITMATATKKATTIYNVTLTLNQNEAETLRRLLSKVGGDIKISRRRFTDSIASALHMAGVNCVDVRFDPQFPESLGFGNEDVKDN